MSAKKRQCCEWLDRGMKDGVPTILCKLPARYNVRFYSRDLKLCTNAGDYCTRHMRTQRADYLKHGCTVEVTPVPPVLRASFRPTQEPHP